MPQYHVIVLDDSCCTRTYHADDIDSARKMAEAYMREGDWNADAFAHDVKEALGGESYEDYSARVGAHPAAVKSRAFRARRRLADLLREAHR